MDKEMKTCSDCEFLNDDGEDLYFCKKTDEAIYPEDSFLTVGDKCPIKEE